MGESKRICVDFDDTLYDKVVAYKPAADIYIDDKALRFEGDWNQTLEEMKKILRLS